MRRLVVAVVLAGLVTAPAAALDVNVVDAADAGCSPDVVTEPDLRVTVRVGGSIVLQTEKAQDTDESYFAVVGSVAGGAGTRVAIEVEEAEPGGFLGFGTTWMACDVAPGEATVLEVDWDGGTMDVLAVGDGPRAARARVVLGEAPPAPRLTVDADAFGANLSWDADPTGSASGHRLGPGNTWLRPGRPLGAAAGTVDLGPLCDGTEHTYRVVREAAPWAVGASVTFRTDNAPPTPPRVLSAREAAGNVTVAWESATTHDVAAYEVHAGPAGFAVTESSRRVDATERNATFARRAGDAEVVVRSVDSGSLSAASAPFAIGAPDRAATLPKGGCPRTLAPGGSDASRTTDDDPAPPPAEQGPVPDRDAAPDLDDPEPPAPPAPPPARGFGWGALALALAAGAAVGAALVLARRR